MSIWIPPNISPELQKLFRDLEAEIRKVTGNANTDLKGKRFMNAGAAIHPNDLVRLQDVDKVIENKLSVLRRAQARKSGQVVSIPGGGGGGGGGVGGPPPLVELYDGYSIVEAYAIANPTELANSCQDTGGTWDFMDGVVAALKAADSRFGYNGKRGNVSDPSKDAVSYYHGDLGVMTVGSNAVYVVDVISGHCGTSPGPAFQDVTLPGVLGAWLPERP